MTAAATVPMCGECFQCRNIERYGRCLYWMDFMYEDMEDASAPWRRSGRATGHIQVMPRSNLKPWTPEQQAELESIARASGANITYTMVKASGRMFETYEAKPGFGFRCY